MRSGIIAAIIVITAFTSADAQTRESPLQGASFLAGCWRGKSGQGQTIEEIYLTPTANLMQGITRYTGTRPNVTGTFTTDYEFTLLDVDGTKTRLRPHPKGQAAVVFTETERAAGKMVWENPTHDFPQKIVYEAGPGDSLFARIEGKTPSGVQSMGWRMGKVTCPTAPR